MTKAMIHVSWHIVTVAFLVLGCALLVAGTTLEDDAREALAVVGAAGFTGAAALAAALGAAHTRSVRGLLRHPGPALLTATAVLAWWGAL
jgi:ABC-type Fe3+-siderophore transport system permease subunit